MVIFNKLPTYYAVGTATVEAAGTTVTGTGTVWTSLQPGDLFGVHIGLAIPIAEVVSDTEFTLLFPWPGAAQTDADYCVQFIPRSVGVQEATRQLLLMLANGNLDAFAALLGGANKVPMFSGPGTLTLINKSELISGVQADKQVADLAARAAYDNSPVDFKVLVSNTGDGRAALYTKLSNATADWSTPAYITGPTGADGVNPRGFYDNATAYAIDDLVYSGGSTWVAKIATTGNAPPTLPITENTQWRLFARAGAAVNPRGDYAAGTAYEPLDAVLYNGSTWIAKIPTTGNAPPTLPTTSNAQWQLMAQKGTDGTGTGDVVGPAGGVVAGDIVSYADATGKLIARANTASQSIVGRFSAGAGPLERLSASQINQILGGWEPIATVTVAGAAALIQNLGNFYMLRISFRVNADNGAAGIRLHPSTDNGSTFITGTSNFSFNLMNNAETISTGVNSVGGSSGTIDGFSLGIGLVTGSIELQSFNSATELTSSVSSQRITSSPGDTRYARLMTQQMLGTAVALNAVRITASAGSFVGKFVIEGVR